MTGNFEVGIRLSMFAGEKNVHHARAGAASKETLDRRRHDFSLGLARPVRGNQRPEAVDDDIHGIAHFDKFFFALNGAGHVEFLIKGHQFEWTLRQFAIVANRHDEVHAERTDAFPLALGGTFAQPLAGNVGPNLIFHPRFFLVADPSSFAGKDKRGFAFERDDDVDVTMNDLESGGVEDGALESSILIPADHEGVQLGSLHPGTDVGISAIDFFLTWQNDLCAYSLTPHNPAAVSA